MMQHFIKSGHFAYAAFSGLLGGNHAMAMLFEAAPSCDKILQVTLYFAKHAIETQ